MSHPLLSSHTFLLFAYIICGKSPNYDKCVLEVPIKFTFGSSPNGFKGTGVKSPAHCMFVEVDRDNVLVQTLLVASLLRFCDEYHSPT